MKRQSIKIVLAVMTFGFLLTGCNNLEKKGGDYSALEEIKGEEVAVLTDAPNVPPPI